MDIYYKVNFLNQLTKYSQEEITELLLQKGKQKMVFPLVKIDKQKTLNDSRRNSNERSI